MKIEMHTITVRELVDGYVNSEEEGVVAFGGKLDVRPKYQREFIYKPTQQEAVINTLTKDYPLNVMYWAVRGDGSYEVIDGQQRTLSICEYVAGRFAYMFRYFGNLASDEQAQILDFLHMAVECAPQYDVTMVLENFSRQDSTIASIEDMKFYLDRIPELQYVLDTGSFWISQSCDPYDACVALLDRTIHVHLKDILPVEVDPPKQMYGRGFDHAVSAEGIAHIREIIAELDKAGYDGTLSIELITNNDPLGKTQRSIHNLQQLI